MLIDSCGARGLPHKAPLAPDPWRLAGTAYPARQRRLCLPSGRANWPTISSYKLTSHSGSNPHNLIITANSLAGWRVSFRAESFRPDWMAHNQLDDDDDS